MICVRAYLLLARSVCSVFARTFSVPCYLPTIRCCKIFFYCRSTPLGYHQNVNSHRAAILPVCFGMYIHKYVSEFGRRKSILLRFVYYGSTFFGTSCDVMVMVVCYSELKIVSNEQNGMESVSSSLRLLFLYVSEIESMSLIFYTTFDAFMYTFTTSVINSNKFPRFRPVSLV